MRPEGGAARGPGPGDGSGAIPPGTGGGAPDLSAIVVTWNVRDLALVCVGRVLERAGDLDVEVLVVDNASTDGTAGALARAHAGSGGTAGAATRAHAARGGTVGAPTRARRSVHVDPSPVNLGFPAANNRALARARGRHVLFLNPDTEVGEGTLEACVAELDRDPSVGAVGCRLVGPDGSLQPECARRHYRLRHLLWEALYLHVLFPRSRVFGHHLMGGWAHEGRRDVEALSGAFLMVRREAALQVGGLPAEVFMYHEDLAFCLRLARAGWRVRYLGDVRTLHHGGASSGRSPSRLELLEGEVRVRLIRERSGPAAGALARALFGVREGARLALAALLHVAPGAGGLRRRYPQVADAVKHARLLLWTVAPALALRGVPAAGSGARSAASCGAEVAAADDGREASAERGGTPLRGPSSDRPRVLVVGPTPPPLHGPSIYVRQILESRAVAAAAELLHLDTADRRDLGNIGRLDVRNVALALLHLARAARLCARRRPDLVYLHPSQNALAFLRDAGFVSLARASGARVVAHLHGEAFGHFHRSASGPVRLLVSRTMRRVDEAWVLGEELVGAFDGLVPPERVRVVANGIPERTRRALEAAADARARGEVAPGEGSPGTLRVLHLGQLARSKGTDLVLRAAAAARASGADVRLTLAGGWGSPAEERALRAEIDRLDAGGWTELAGVVDGEAKARLFAGASAFALLSRFPPGEGQPMAVLEAMCAGLAVVTTPRGALPGTLAGGAAGMVLSDRAASDSEVVDEAARALEALARDGALRERLGRAARARFLAEYTEEAWVGRFAAALRGAAAGGVPEQTPGRPRQASSAGV